MTELRNTKLTQGRLKELLLYDPETGMFTRKISHGYCGKGSIAGNLKDTGYIRIRVDLIEYPAHRLAWLYMKGHFPKKDIDHINRKRNDNRFKNLRIVSRSHNLRNASIHTDNVSGVTGVSFDNIRQKWLARICVMGKSIHLGRVKSKANAVQLRWEAEKIYNFTSYNSESSAFLYLKNKKLI